MQIYNFKNVTTCECWTKIDFQTFVMSQIMFMAPPHKIWILVSIEKIDFTFSNGWKNSL